MVRLWRKMLQLGSLVVLGLGSFSGVHASEIQQEASYEQGVPLLLSFGEVATVGLSPIAWDGTGRRRIAFQLLAANNSSQPFDADPARISATADGNRVAIVSAPELASEARRRGNWNRFAIAIAGGLNASTAGSQAGRYSEQGTFRGRVVGDRTGATYQGQYSAQGYDGAAATAASRRELDQTNELLARSRQADQSRVEDLENQVLLRTTIRPGQHIVRTVVLDPPRQLGAGSELAVSFELGGEQHLLRFVKRVNEWEPAPRNVERRVATPVPTSIGHQPAESLRPDSAPSYPTNLPSSDSVSMAAPAEQAASSMDLGSMASVHPVHPELSSPRATAVSSSTPEERLAELLIDHPMYLSHLSWAGGQVARGLGGSVKGGRALNRAAASNPNLLREGVAAAFSGFISHQDMTSAVALALRDHVPQAQVTRALSMTSADRISWYQRLGMNRDYQALLLDNLRIPNSFEVIDRLSAELHARFPRYRFHEAWKPD